MSRAYCLTCNAHVHETPSGTCPLGHPVAADGRGPEPWVGFAGDTETEVTEVQLHHLDTTDRPREHVGVGQYANGAPHVNGAANGSANGHARPLASSSVAFPSLDGDDRSAADLASDDLTALLAEALRANTPEAEAPTPVDEAPTSVDEPTPAVPGGAVPADDDADWSELASLAAELHLDEDVATDDGPSAPATPDPTPFPPQPTDQAPEGELSASTIDDLLAELTGGTLDADPAAGGTDTPVEAPHALAPPVVEAPLPSTEDTVPWDAPPPSDDIGSPPAADPAEVSEPEPAPAEASAPAPTVDLYNFTARGKRVGGAGAALPSRKHTRGRRR